jgi:hypothetical protein
MPDDIDPAPPSKSFGGSAVRDFFVDFLGSLVPGILYTSAAGFTLLFSWWFLCRSIIEILDPTQNLHVQGVDALNQFRYELLVFFLVLSYVMGHLFYRKDPKGPDQASAEFLLKKLGPGEPVDMAIRRGDGVSPADVRFPYLYLSEYLEGRGLSHLAALIPWKGEKPETHHLRTKMFINILKIRLHYLVPDKCGEVTRNEAHVRLVSSVWYTTRALLWVVVFNLALTAGAIVLSWSSGQTLHLGDPARIVLFNTVFVCFLIWVQRQIRKFFHYQRVREIVYVLETAHFANKSGQKVLWEADAQASPPAGGSVEGRGANPAEATEGRKPSAAPSNGESKKSSDDNAFGSRVNFI